MVFWNGIFLCTKLIYQLNSLQKTNVENLEIVFKKPKSKIRDVTGSLENLLKF